MDADGDFEAPSSWRVLGGIPLALATAAVSVALTFDRPAPRPPSASAFSGETAQAHLEHVASAPRPTDSPELERVRDWLLGEIEGEGLEPSLQIGTFGERPLTNVLARIEGRGDAGAVLFVAHYDSRSWTPGAADNGAAVVCMRQVLGLAARAEPPRNDLVFLFTDGEEEGLLGARLFVAEHPWMAGVRCVVNFDAIGNDGVVVMFQTGADSSAWVERYASAAPHPVATSLAPVVYELLPNDTDFTPFLEAGAPGINLAIVGGGSAYHSPIDLPENLSAGTLQLLGDTMLSLQRAFGDAPLPVASREELTYFDVAGARVVRYGRAVSLALLVAAVAASLATWLVASRRAGLRAADHAFGFVTLGITVACSAALGMLGWNVFDRVGASLAPEGIALPRGNFQSSMITMSGLTLVCAGTLAGLLEALRRSPRASERATAVLGAALAVWAALLVAIGTWEPRAAAQLPLLVLLQATGWALSRRMPLLLPALGAASVVLVAPHLALTFQLLSTAPSDAVAMFVVAAPLIGGLFLPWFRRYRSPTWLVALLALAGVLLLVLGGVWHSRGA